MRRYVDYTELWHSMVALFIYIFVAFLFFRLYMSSDDCFLGGLRDDEAAEQCKLLMNEVHGGNGDWTGLNTLIFLFTSFTTVGYGNHPSLKTTTPPCEYPGPHSKAETPFSNLMPPDMQQPTYGDTVEAKTWFEPLPRHCFSEQNVLHPECWVMADEFKIFDFSRLVMYERLTKKQMPRQFAWLDEAGINDTVTGKLADQRRVKVGKEDVTVQMCRGAAANASRCFFSVENVSVLVLPGGLGNDKTIPGLAPETTLASANGGLLDSCVAEEGSEQVMVRPECWPKYVQECEGKLGTWREEEAKKNAAKIVTVLFVLTGILILGTFAGSAGHDVSALMQRGVGKIEHVVDISAQQVSALGSKIGSNLETIVGVDVFKSLPDLGSTSSEKKGVFLSFIALFSILFLGTIVYMLLDAMTFVDAMYFTVVTATTVGFGDYVPSSTGAKVFSLVYVPVSVVMVAGALQYVANVPLKKRSERLENYVLSQFGKHVCQEDFEQVRRSGFIRPDEDIRPNDFVIAMLTRLGRIDKEDVNKIRRLFANLDRDRTGVLNNDDIQMLVDERTFTETEMAKELSILSNGDLAGFASVDTTPGGEEQGQDSAAVLDMLRGSEPKSASSSTGQAAAAKQSTPLVRDSGSTFEGPGSSH